MHQIWPKCTQNHPRSSSDAYLFACDLDRHNIEHLNIGTFCIIGMLPGMPVLIYNPIAEGKDIMNDVGQCFTENMDSITHNIHDIPV